MLSEAKSRPESPLETASGGKKILSLPAAVLSASGGLQAGVLNYPVFKRLGLFLLITLLPYYLITCLCAKEQLQVYTVVKGDTLIKIARKIYDDPSQWRKIHFYNKYIKNPRWIFPGDELVVPVEVPDEVVEEVEEVKEVKEVPREKVPVVSTITASTLKKEIVKKIEEDSVLADEDWEYDGYVSGEKDRKIIIGQGDIVFLDVGRKQKVKVFDRFTIYRRDREILHPETGEKLGDLIRKIGVLEVTTDIQKDSCTGRIVMAREPVLVGDMIKKQPK